MTFLSSLLASIVEWLIQNNVLPWLKREVKDAVDESKAVSDQNERDAAKTSEELSRAAESAASDTFS